MEQFTSFVQEALEFLSLLRASEKERFEAQKKYMDETTKILKDLAETILKNNTVIKNALDDLKGSLNAELKQIEENLGLENLMQAINALESSVDLLQRGSTILDYKFTVQKTREILDEIQKQKSRNEGGVPAARASPSLSSKESAEVPALKVSSPPKPEAAPGKPPKKAEASPPKSTGKEKGQQKAAPATSKEKSPKKSAEPAKAKTSKSTAATAKAGSSGQEGASAPKYNPLASAMGTRSQAPRRVVNLKKPKIVDVGGEPVEIETGTDEDK